MATRDQWYKPNLLYNIHYRPPKTPEPPQKIVETVRFNPSFCTCGEHSCGPKYRMERRVIWPNKEKITDREERSKYVDENDDVDDTINRNIDIHNVKKNGNDIGIRGRYYKSGVCMNGDCLSGDKRNGTDSDKEKGDVKDRTDSCCIGDCDKESTVDFSIRDEDKNEHSKDNGSVRYNSEDNKNGDSVRVNNEDGAYSSNVGGNCGNGAHNGNIGDDSEYGIDSKVERGDARYNKNSDSLKEDYRADSNGGSIREDGSDGICVRNIDRDGINSGMFRGNGEEGSANVSERIDNGVETDSARERNNEGHDRDSDSVRSICKEETGKIKDVLESFSASSSSDAIFSGDDNRKDSNMSSYIQDLDEEISSAFGIMSIYCNSELHSWVCLKDEVKD